MSTIHLTEELIRDIQEVLLRHDPQNEQAGVAIQYLAAIEGFLLARFPGPYDEKRKLLERLFEFSDQVLQDNVDDTPAPETPAGGDPAVGIWKPS